MRVPGLPAAASAPAPAAAAAVDADGDTVGPPTGEGEGEDAVGSSPGGNLEPCSRNAPAAICAALKPLHDG